MTSFYSQYIKMAKEITDGISDDAELFKNQYINNLLNNNKVYKFISFGEKENDKITTFKQGKVWFSYYKSLNDDTECNIPIDMKYVSRVTGLNVCILNDIIQSIQQTMDILSLTIEYHEYMWEIYADYGNGMCIEYEVNSYESMYPVEYLEKTEIDYDRMMVNAIKNKKVKELAIIPWVIKNPYNMTSKLDSTKEKEVRILYSPFDDAELNGGVVYPNVKDKLKYPGIGVPCEKVGLKISQVILGDRCSDKIVEELREFMDKSNIRYSLHKNN